MADQVLPEATPDSDDAGTHYPVVHEIVAPLICSHRLRIDKDEWTLLASNVDVVAGKKAFRDQAQRMCAEANRTVIDTCARRILAVSTGGKKPFRVKDGHAVPAAVDRNDLASAQAGNI